MEGFWTVEFGSNAGVYSGGVLFFNDGKIAGGDAGYYYLGTYEMTGDHTFSAILHVKPFIKEAKSIFKTKRKSFTLSLDGDIKDQNHAIARGRPEEMPEFGVGLVLERRVEAVAA